jgi:molecular chaperone DnaJ
MVGDLYCNMIVEVPVNLNNEQKELLKKFEESLSNKDSKKEKHEPMKQSFLDKLASFFKKD